MEKKYPGLEDRVKLLVQQRDDKPLAKLDIPIDELCQRYMKLFTGAVSDALRELAMEEHALPSYMLPLRDEMKVCGPAFTIKSTKTPMIKGEMNVRARMLDALYEGCVCVWETGGDDYSAHWGEVMTQTSKKKGVVGAVVEGGLRDTVQVLAQNFPVFYKYRTPHGSLGHCQMVGFEQVLKIGEVYIHPGDIVFGDIDGVVIVPREVACQVLLSAEEKLDDEKEFKSWIEGGMSAKDVIDNGGYF